MFKWFFINKDSLFKIGFVTKCLNNDIIFVQCKEKEIKEESISLRFHPTILTCRIHKFKISLKWKKKHFLLTIPLYGPVCYNGSMQNVFCFSKITLFFGLGGTKNRETFYPHLETFYPAVGKKSRCHRPQKNIFF